jgi:peptidoglycan-associated lipoprotein
MPLRFDRSSTGLVLTLAALVALAACGGKKRPPALATDPGGGPSSTARESVPTQAIDEGPDLRALEGEGAEGADLHGWPTGAVPGGPLADVRFRYDSAELSDEARATLERHALWLQANRDARVTVEGHCDERGTVDYNLALGELRARAARDYLVGLGVAPERVRTVSFGKERPLDPGSGEAAWAKNRRAAFAVGR